jgi:hypothetical protein
MVLLLMMVVVVVVTRKVRCLLCTKSYPFLPSTGTIILNCG